MYGFIFYITCCPFIHTLILVVFVHSGKSWKIRESQRKTQVRKMQRSKIKLMKNIRAYIPGEPSRARLLTALTVDDSYVTTLPHAKESFHAFAVSTA